MCPDTCKGSTPAVPVMPANPPLQRTVATVPFGLPLAPAAERQYRYADLSMMRIALVAAVIIAAAGALPRAPAAERQYRWTDGKHG